MARNLKQEDDKEPRERPRRRASARGPAEDGQENGVFRLRGDLLAAGILATLRRWNAHGYRLGRELVQAGLPMLDSGTLYRTLRELERAGLVSSFWDTSSSGPARRMYSLTKTGDVFLSAWIDTLQRFQSVFQGAAGEAAEEAAEPRAQPAGHEPGRPARKRRAAAQAATRARGSVRRSGSSGEKADRRN